MAAHSKIFCIGFQKTGTTSLYAALTTLGFRTIAVFGRDLSATELRSQGARMAIDIMQDYDAAQDMPWPIFFRELDAAYPNSKFILTLRDAASWFSSIENHFGDTPNDIQAFVYGHDAACPTGNRERYVEVYRHHIAEARRFFQSRPNDFLEMDLAAGHGWRELCGFLKIDAPDKPFPVKNTRADRQTVAYKIKRKVLSFVGKSPQPERL